VYNDKTNYENTIEDKQHMTFLLHQSKKAQVSFSHYLGVSRPSTYCLNVDLVL